MITELRLFSSFYKTIYRLCVFLHKKKTVWLWRDLIIQKILREVMNLFTIY